MGDTGNRAIEQAEAMVVLERDTAIAGIREQLTKPGAADCDDCGEEISEGRRAAMPSARRCAPCEARHEQTKRRGW